MRWDDETYVRVYVRDTADWISWSWETRALFLFLLRKVDRAGLLPLGKRSVAGVASIVGMPVDVVVGALEPLIEDGCVSIRDGVLIIPNFVEAQEAKRSDVARQRESRRKARVTRVNVTPCHEMSRAVTRDVAHEQNVTPGHDLSQAVTRDGDVVTFGHEMSLARKQSVAKQSKAEGSAEGGDAVPAEPRSERRLKSVPPPPADREIVVEPEALIAGASVPSDGSSLVETRARAFKTWERVYEASRRQYGKYIYGPSFDLQPMSAVVSQALTLSVDSGFTPDEILLHWFESYLRDDGRGVLVQRRHPLALLERNIGAAGLPKAKRKALPPKPAPEPASSTMKVGERLTVFDDWLAKVNGDEKKVS